MLTALLAWPVLDEPLTWLAIIGMLLTLGGIAWVVVERSRTRRVAPLRTGSRHRLQSAGLRWAIGLVLAKLGMGEFGTDGSGAVVGHVVRMLFGASAQPYSSCCSAGWFADWARPMNRSRGADCPAAGLHLHPDRCNLRSGTRCLLDWCRSSGSMPAWQPR